MIELLIEIWKDDWVVKSIAILILFAIAMVPLAIYGIMLEQKEWEAFKVTQNCEIVEHVKGDSSVGVGYGVMTNGSYGSGVIVSSTPSKTGWLCDDGITYWR